MGLVCVKITEGISPSSVVFSIHDTINLTSTDIGHDDLVRLYRTDESLHIEGLMYYRGMGAVAPIERS